MAGAPTYFGMAVPDRARARLFYGRLLGLALPTESVPDPARIETTTIPGFVHNTDQLARIGVYFGVADIDAATREVTRLGGQVLSVTPMIAGHGRFANCLDDQGVAFGLHEAAAP